MFKFAHTEYLYLLYLLPLLVLFVWLMFRKQKKLLSVFTEKKMISILIPDKSNYKYYIKNGITIFAITLLIFALANPLIGSRVEEVKQTGIDVFILLDVSNSMKAEDIRPNRLEKAKHQISQLINRLKGDRIGLIVFAGDAFTQFPITSDYSAANLFLNAVNFNSVPRQGTNIAAAINLAINSFSYEEETSKAIVIITDGEDHEGGLKEAVDDAVKQGIIIYAIGLGSPAGAPIPVYNQQGRQTDFRRDNDGNIVLTKLDETILVQITSTGKGKYFRSGNYEDELDLIYRDLSELEKTEFGSTRITGYEDKFYYLLIPAILLLLFDFFISERKNKIISKLMKRLGFET